MRSIILLCSNESPVLTASKLLYQRIQDITYALKGESSWSPTIEEIEQTHAVYVSAHFKPYVATAFEYIKVAPVKCGFNTTIEFPIPAGGEFINDIVCHVKISAVTAKKSESGVSSVRYCEFPGNRLFEKVSLEVDDKVLSSYSYWLPTMLEKTRIMPHKRTGYNRLVGQQNTLIGMSEVKNIAGGSAQEEIRYTGPQTPKPVQPPLELWNKLHFWFTDDVKLSLPLESLLIGKRFIKLQIAAVENILFGEYDTPTVECELYINNIFINAEVMDIIMSRASFTLARLYHERNVSSDGPDVYKNSGTIDILVNGSKPFEYIFLGCIPNENKKSWRNWHRFSQQNETATDGCTYWETQPTIDKLEITANGITMYNNAESTFYNSYMPFRYGSEILTPDDTGVLFINFSLFPGQYQPSGHFDFRRARESYYKITPNIDTPMTIIALSSYIAFLTVDKSSVHFNN